LAVVAMIVLLSPVITFTFSMRRVMQNNFLIGQENAQLNFMTKRSLDPQSLSRMGKKLSMVPCQ